MITPIQAGLAISGRTLDLLLLAIRDAQRYRARNGAGPLRVYAELADILTSAGALSEVGQADIEPGPVGEAEFMTVNEAAERMGVTERTVRRKARALGGRQVGGVWLLDRAAVLEHLEGAA